jgi:hypothetical protein
MSMASMLATDHPPQPLNTKNILSIAHTMQNWDDEGTVAKIHNKTAPTSILKRSSRYKSASAGTSGQASMVGWYAVTWLLISFLTAALACGLWGGRIF